MNWSQQQLLTYWAFICIFHCSSSNLLLSGRPWSTSDLSNIIWFLQHYLCDKFYFLSVIDKLIKQHPCWSWGRFLPLSQTNLHHFYTLLGASTLLCLCGFQYQTVLKPVSISTILLCQLTLNYQSGRSTEEIHFPKRQECISKTVIFPCTIWGV